MTYDHKFAPFCARRFAPLCARKFAPLCARLVFYSPAGEGDREGEDHGATVLKTLHRSACTGATVLGSRPYEAYPLGI